MYQAKILDFIKNCDLSYRDELQEFVNYYLKVVESLKREVNENLLSVDDTKIAKKYFEWLDKDGYKHIWNSLQYVNENMKDYVIEFARCNTFLLKLSQPNEYKVIDHMFSIPRKMEKEFKEKLEDEND